MADPNELLEEIDLGSDELEEVTKIRIVKFDYPIITLTRGESYFFVNAAAKQLFDQFNGIKFFTTPEYVIFADAKGEMKNAFTLKKRGAKQKYKNYSYYAVAYPAALKEKKLKPGYYKLYKCKQGLAFKRYEPLGVLDEIV